MEKVMKYAEPNKSSLAPTEILAEFLTSIMKKDYEAALKLCTEILTQEPNNSTAKEFYPLIVKKLEMIDSEELENLSESDDSTYSLSDSGSFQAGNMDSSSYSSESLMEADDDFRFRNVLSSQTKHLDLKKEMTVSTASRSQYNTKPVSKKELTKASRPCARVLSTPGVINRTATTGNIKRYEKPKTDSEEFSPLENI